MLILMFQCFTKFHSRGFLLESFYCLKKSGVNKYSVLSFDLVHHICFFSLLLYKCPRHNILFKLQDINWMLFDHFVIDIVYVFCRKRLFQRLLDQGMFSCFMDLLELGKQQLLLR